MRKAMIELSSKEKAELRSAAQRLKPAIHMGKNGLTPHLLEELNKVLDSDKLVKIAFKEGRDAMEALVGKIEAATASVCVGGVGKRRSFYREKSDA
jgi:RNA-binding protein